MRFQAAKCLKILEASTGIEPVYTDLQSAASPLRQLAGGVALLKFPAEWRQADIGAARPGRRQGADEAGTDARLPALQPTTVGAR